MAQNNFGGPGLGLPVPATLYPAVLQGGAQALASNVITLAPAQTFLLPPGPIAVVPGKYSVIQFLDPITGAWLPIRSVPGHPQFLQSDGFNYRLINVTGAVLGGVVTTVGSGYIAGSTTITPSAGNSTWTAVVGGALNTTPSIVSAGANYTIAPQVVIPAPPAPGLQATAYATLSSGTVSAISVVNMGAGYLTAPVVTLVPSPNDPNLGSITNAVIKFPLTGAGTLTGAICTNSGSAQTSAPTLTVAGAGTGATATAVLALTATTASVVAAGTGYNANTLLTSVGGTVAAASAAGANSPFFAEKILEVRPCAMTVAVSSGTISSIASVVDGGLYTGAPTYLVLATWPPGTPAQLPLTLGTTVDTAIIQQL